MVALFVPTISAHQLLPQARRFTARTPLLVNLMLVVIAPVTQSVQLGIVASQSCQPDYFVSNSLPKAIRHIGRVCRYLEPPFIAVLIPHHSG